MCLLISTTPAWAGESVQLDKDFAFRLTRPEAPPAASALTVSVLPGRKLDAPLKTPQGEPLPLGSRILEFNGQTYYYIPL